MQKRLPNIVKTLGPLSVAFLLGQVDPVDAQNLSSPGSQGPDATLTTDTPAPFDWIKIDNPRLPYEGLAVLGGLGALFAAYAYRRRLKVATPYVLFGAAAVVALVAEKEEKDWKDIPSEILVVDDRSDSVRLIGDRDVITEQIRQKLLKYPEGLPEVTFRFVDITAAPGQTGGNSGTDIFLALNNLEDINVENMAGLIILTDGQAQNVPSLSPFGENIPVHVLLSGQPDEFDRVADIVGNTPRFGLVGEQQTIKFRVDDLGFSGTGEPIRVTISNDSVIEQTFDVRPGTVIETNTTIQHSGSNIISIDAEHLEGELTDANNQIIAVIEGIREDLNVLLLSGSAANKGNRAIREYYKSDPDSNLIQIMLTRLPQDLDDTPPEEMALTPVPLREIFGQAIEKYDLIIFDSYEDFKVFPPTYLRNLVAYAENGGSLFVIAGPEYAGSRSLQNTPIGPLLPIEPTGEIIEEAFLPQITEAGGRHPVTRNLGGISASADQPDWGPWTRIVGSHVLAGDVLMEGPDGTPLLVLNRLEAPAGAINPQAEQGRVAVLLSDSSWLWAKGYQGGGPQDQMLGRISHWLMKQTDLEEEVLRMTSAGQGHLLIERQTMSIDAPPPVTLQKPSGKVEEVTLLPAGPGLWQASVAVEEDGIFTATEDDGKIYTAFANIGYDEGNEEMRSLVTTPDILRPIVTETGGYIGYMSDGEGRPTLPDLRIVNADSMSVDQKMSGEGWIGLRHTDAKELEGIKRTPLIPPWMTTLFMVGCFAAGFYRSGNHNLFSAWRNRILPATPANDGNAPRPEA